MHISVLQNHIDM